MLRIQLRELVGTSHVVTQTVHRRLSDKHYSFPAVSLQCQDYSVPAVSLKCQEQLDSEETMVITENKGQELLDTSATHVQTHVEQFNLWS